ncbi:hypothetical protein SCLCIDRAFT_1224524 [Scleroderma citrinum Foug A]|uniref:Uncharacterized protein n=1 Tax=Scleroderma citrinum Foug A TaxID=1036808 RepID=A0A0C3D4T7_9AGAM|nr:hypothetical protein SCLCIDRAFT_1224524 [Scleroderma citrinum Foug A]
MKCQLLCDLWRTPTLKLSYTVSYVATGVYTPLLLYLMPNRICHSIFCTLTDPVSHVVHSLIILNVVLSGSNLEMN